MIVTQIYSAGSQESTAIRQNIHSRARLDVIDPPSVVVIAESSQGAELLARTETLSCRACKLIQIAPLRNRRVSSHAQQGHIGLVRRTFGDQIYRPTNGVGILICGESLIHLNGVHEIRRYNV